MSKLCLSLTLPSSPVLSGRWEKINRSLEVCMDRRDRDQGWWFPYLTYLDICCYLQLLSRGTWKMCLLFPGESPAPKISFWLRIWEAATRKPIASPPSPQGLMSSWTSTEAKGCGDPLPLRATIWWGELLKIQLSMRSWEKKPGLGRHLSIKVCQMLFGGQRIYGFCRHRQDWCE